MVCNTAPPKITHVPEYFATATCPSCGKLQIVSHYDLKRSGRALDGTAELVCALCKTLNQTPDAR